jgi:hypothetical protein
MPTPAVLLLRLPVWNRYLEYLDQTNSRGKKSAGKATTSHLAPRSSTSSFTSDLTRSESLEAALAEVSGSNSLRRRRTQMQQQQTGEPYSSTSSSPRWSTLHERGEAGFWGGFDSSREAGGSGSSLFDFLLPGGDEDDEVSLFCPRASARARKGFVAYVLIARQSVALETAWQDSSGSLMQQCFGTCCFTVYAPAHVMLPPGGYDQQRCFA